MKRGEIYVPAARGAYTGKPRPVVVVQDDRFEGTGSVTVCPLTTNDVQAPLSRIPIRATAGTGIEHQSYIKVDKVTTMPRVNLDDLVGRLEAADLVRLDRALVVFLGMAG